MKKTRQKKQTMGLFLFFITSMLSFSVNSYLTEGYRDVLSEINTIFDLSIREDKSRRKINLASPVYEGYSDGNKEFSLAVKDKVSKLRNVEKYRKLAPNEKSYIADHNYLQYKNPIKVNVLDSLFKTKLSENNISLQIEIQYIVDADTAYSAKNRAFYATALPLEKITTGLKDQIILQAFVKPSFLYRISPIISIFTRLFFFISLGGLIWIFRYKKNDDELLVVDETNLFVFPLAIELPKCIKQLSSTTFFNTKDNTLIRNGETIYLTGLRLAVFTLMMNSDDYFVQSATIKSQLWPKLDNVKDVFNKTIERLRTDLKPFPELEVHYDRRRNGYYLKVVVLEEAIYNSVFA